MLLQNQVGSQPTISLPDGQQPVALAGKAAEQIIAQLHGTYYTQSYRGNVFVGSTAVGGVVPPAFSGLTQVFAVWNPPNSQKNIVPIRCSVGLVTAGVVTDNIVFGILTNTGSQQITGTVITAANLSAPVPMNLGAPSKSVANFVATANGMTVTTTPSLLKPTGISVFMAGSPQANNTIYAPAIVDFNGKLVIPPGAVLFASGNIGMVGTYDISLTWAEVPI